jgi:hypothetical protein
MSDQQPLPPFGPPMQPPEIGGGEPPVPGASPPPAPASEGGGGRPRWLLLGLAVLLLGVVAGGAIVGWLVLREDTPAYPDAWDDRVTAIVAFVEDERGLEFEHPVYVDFLPEDEFREKVTTSKEELTDEDRKEIEQATSLLRALGLVEGDLDLFEEQNQLSGDATLAFYDPDTKRVTVRGTELTPSVESTLAHELTHALQDQHFDLEAVREEAGEDRALVYRALVEGDAMNVQQAFNQSELTRTERQEVEREDQEAGDRAYTDREPALVAFMAAPYAIGPTFASLVEADGGRRALDRLYREGLPDEVALLDPTRLDDEPLEVELPSVPDGAERIDDGEFGAFGWFVVLAARLDGQEALAAIDGWGGDSYVSYDDGGRVCVEARYRGTNRKATEAMEGLLDEWAASMPSGAASVDSSGDVVELRSCDPGGDSTAKPNDVVKALQYPVGRLVTTRQLLDQYGRQFDLDQVWCVSKRMFDELTIEQLNSTTPDPDVIREVQNLTLSCLRDG